jgi:hypothetical protein
MDSWVPDSIHFRNAACGEELIRNGANGMSDIEGKATRVGARERGQRTSFKAGVFDRINKMIRMFSENHFVDSVHSVQVKGEREARKCGSEI